MFLLIFIIFELNSKVTITMIIQKSIILLDEIWTKFFFFSYILHGCLSYVLIFIIKSNNDKTTHERKNVFASYARVLDLIYYLLIFMKFGFHSINTGTFIRKFFSYSVNILSSSSSS